MNYKGYIIQESNGHGKAGKGFKLTSSIKVMKKLGQGYLNLKYFRFIVGDPKSSQRAKQRATKFVDEQLARESSFREKNLIS